MENAGVAPGDARRYRVVERNGATFEAGDSVGASHCAPCWSMWGGGGPTEFDTRVDLPGVQYWPEGGDCEWAPSIHRGWNGVDLATETSYVRFLNFFGVQQLDILTILRWHNSENEKTSFERVYIEETLCIFGSKVGHYVLAGSPKGLRGGEFKNEDLGREVSGGALEKEQQQR